MNIKIVVATHKKYQMPADEMYVPIQVGKSINKVQLPYTGDNLGDNISKKNPNYCELTAMYWAWKNLNADYVGLAHYRRHFCVNSWFLGSTKSKKNNVMTSDKANKLLEKYDVILPKKRHYWIETLMSHYQHTHQIKDLKATRDIIEAFYPDYLESFDKVMNRRSAHMFNMFIMRRDIFDAYSKWLFNVLLHLEKCIDIRNYSPYEARVFGYISELLMDVWLDVNHVHAVEMPVMFMEKQNWVKKITKFITNKFASKEQSKLKSVPNKKTEEAQMANIN